MTNFEERAVLTTTLTSFLVRVLPSPWASLLRAADPKSIDRESLGRLAKFLCILLPRASSELLKKRLIGQLASTTNSPCY